MGVFRSLNRNWFAFTVDWTSLPAYIDKSIHLNCIDAKISFGAERRIIEGVALFRLSKSEIFVEEYCGAISVKCKLAVTNCPGQWETYCHLPSPDSDHGPVCRHEKFLGNVPLPVIILVIALILVDPLVLGYQWTLIKLEHEGLASSEIPLS